MPNEPTPTPIPAEPGRFKTVVAWVCGPIVLVELIAMIVIMIWAASVMRSAQSSKTYISMARLIVGGMEVNPKLESGEAIPDSFYGTCAELMMSGDVRSRATRRVYALHKDMAPQQAKIEVVRTPGTRILVLRATCEDPAFAQAILDAVMDEFIAMRREMTGPSREERTIAIQDELVRLEKDLQHTEERQKAAKQSGASAEELDELKTRLERTKRSYDKLTDMLRELDRQPGVGNLIAILERASPALLVVPDFSFSSLFR